MVEYIVVLTQYKRNHLEKQLFQIEKQTLKPKYVVVFQNENHVDISNLKDKYNFIHIKSDYNTKFFGRFASCFTFPVDICIVMDDDIIPGINCFKNYIDQCIEYDAIIGGNGRIGINNIYRKHFKIQGDVGVRHHTQLVDFVGHLWCFKKNMLYNMFSIKPYTYDTGEDMHLCFSSKIKENVKSYIAKQINKDDMCDITNNQLANDIYSSYKTTTNELRSNVEKYFINNYNLNLITNN
jgi:hypothetical protein